MPRSHPAVRRVAWWFLLATLALLPFESWLPQIPAGHFTVTGSAGEVLIACTFDGVRGNAYTTLQPDRTANVVVKIVKPAPAGSIDAHFEGAQSTFDQIEANGAAAKAGLQVGDRVIAVDGVSVTDISGYDAMEVITQRPPGTAAALTIQRDGAVRTVTVTVHA